MSKAKLSKGNKALWVGLGVIFFISIVLVAMPYAKEEKYLAPVSSTASTSAIVPEVLPVSHIDTPNAVKAIYMTACVASTKAWKEGLETLIKNTELNSIVIDIKDYTGTVSFNDPALLDNGGAGCKVKDMKEFIAELHKNNIYVIGRIAVFQDPLMTRLHPEWAVKSKSTGGVWKDRKGLSFIDVGAKPYWDYIIDIAKASYAQGFDEINFDYIRYPSDGNLADAHFSLLNASTTKAESVKSFFSYLHDGLKDTGMKTSADLFGLVTVAMDDLGIGQVLTNALPYFDYIDPMVYPSHFAPNTDGYKNPAEHPYEIIKYSMGTGLARENAFKVKEGIATSTPSKLRPWLQDFDLGAPYNAPEVRAEIKATYDVGLTSWLMWDASNKYSKDAYLAD